VSVIVWLSLVVCAGSVWEFKISCCNN